MTFKGAIGKAVDEVEKTPRHDFRIEKGRAVDI